MFDEAVKIDYFLIYCMSSNEKLAFLWYCCNMNLDSFTKVTQNRTGLTGNNFLAV